MYVQGWSPAVYTTYTSQNFRLFHVSKLSVLNFRISLLMYPWSLPAVRRVLLYGERGRPASARVERYRGRTVTGSNPAVSSGLDAALCSGGGRQQRWGGNRPGDWRFADIMVSRDGTLSLGKFSTQNISFFVTCFDKIN